MGSRFSLNPSTPLAAGRRPALRLGMVPLLLGVAAGRHACGDPEPSGDGRPGPAPVREVRAVWVTRWDYRTEEDVRAIIARCASLNLNRVVFQVRGQADAFYRSSLEPWGEELASLSEGNGDPGFDPLETAIDEARRRGLELHAWANLLPGWKGPTPPRSEKHVVHLHPEWFMMDEAGRRRILDRDRYALLNPCLPAVREHLKAVLGEIVARYPVDGLQIDYARFLDRDPARGEDVPYDPPTLALFRSETGASPRKARAAWDLFRRRALDLLVAEIASQVRVRRPACRLSLAAIRDREHARSHLFQDAEGWVRRRWVDQLYPMNYEPEAGRFGTLAQSWTRACGGEAVVVGLGVHLLDGPDSVREQVRLVREARASGYCLFAYSEIFPSRSPESRNDAAAEARRAQLRALLRALNRPAALTAFSSE